MALNKAMRAALAALSYPERNVKKTYRVERELMNLTARKRKNPALYHIWERRVSYQGHPIPVRIFSSSREPEQRLLLFFHGGGWVTGSIDSYDAVCADMAALTGRLVASVDYRLAPEHRFPFALEDCYAVAREIFLNNGLPGIKPEEIVLIGDSAGGNLAAAVSLMARDRGEFLPARQILLYPAVWNDHSDASPFPSIAENGTGYILTSRRVQEFMDLYRSCDEDLQNPYFAPLLASDLSNQPDTLIITAEYCPLRDEGEAYGERLRQAGGRVQVFRVPDAIHGFFSLPARLKPVRQAYEQINHFLED